MRTGPVLRNLALLTAILTLISAFALPAGTHGTSNPIAAFTYESCVACAAPGDVVFFNATWSTSNNPIVSYTWDFGDGSALYKTTSPTTTHMYGGIPAKWQVTLTVQDSAGLADATIQRVLFWTIPHYTFHPANPAVGQQILFNATGSINYNSTNPIKEYDWNFGDGTIGTGVLATHSYSTAATFRAILTLQTSYGNPSISKTLTVGQSNTNVTYNLITDRDAYNLGDTVHIKLNATNHGIQPVTFNFPDGCSGFRFQITNSTGNIVYTNVPPPLAPCSLVITTITIQPGETLTVATLDWKQLNQQGQQVPPGSYTIIGVIHYQSPYQTAPVAEKTVMIQSSTADFQLTVDPTSVVIARGYGTTLTITATAVNGFTGTINLSATIQPGTKHPPTLSTINSITLTATNSTGTATLTISTNRSTNCAAYTITITGTSGTTTHTISAIANVTNRWPAYQII